MLAPTHIVIGLGAVCVSGHLTGTVPSGPGLLAVLIGSVAPDIDGDGVITRPGKIMRRFLGKRLSEFVDAVFAVVHGILKIFFIHRGLFHSLLLAVLALVYFAGIHSAFWYWFFLAYVFHLVADMMTPEGIPVLAPFSSRKVSIASIRTGSRTEGLLRVILLAFVLIAGWFLLPESFQETYRELFNKLTA